MRQSPRRISTDDLTLQEQKNVRTALQYLRARFGTWTALGKVLRFVDTSIIHVVAGRKAASPTMAFRVARLVQIPIDDLLTGKFPPKGTCTNCGHCEGEVTR